MQLKADNHGEAPLALALDIGSSSLRAIVYDRQGHAVSGLEVQQRYSLHTTQDGGAEIDPRQLLEATTAAIDHILALAGPRAEQIAAIGISTFWHSLMAVDAHDRPLTPVYTWADTRSRNAAAQLRASLDERAIHARTGCVFHPSYWPAKITWLAQTQPDTWKEATLLLSFGEYLLRELFGEAACSFSMASGTGLFDQNELTWDQPLLDTLHLDAERLAPLCDRDAGLTGLRHAYAQRWPALQRIPWYPALGDGACSNIGSGCLTPERLAIMVGTSGAMRAALPTEHIDIPWGLWCYRVDRLRFLLGGALSEGGDVVAWLAHILNITDLATAEAHIQQAPPDGHGLTVLPFLAGERSPGWASQARGAIIGLSLSTQTLDIFQAHLEAIAYRFGLIHDMLVAALYASDPPSAMPTTSSAGTNAAPDTRARPSEHGSRPQNQPTHEVIASGGGLVHSPAWMQIIADVLNNPVTASAEAEASSRGAAILALQACGVLKDLADAPAGTTETYQPDATRHAIYRAAMERQNQLYEHLIGPLPSTKG